MDEDRGPAAAARRKAPTIKDIAAAAGVSKSAVSRALLGQGDVSAETRDRVEAAANRLGYVANAMAAGLRSRTRTIGVVLRDINRPFYGALFSAMQTRSEQRAYRLVAMTSGGELDVESAIGAVRSLLSLQVDGLVIASAQLDSKQITPFIERVPMVVAGRMESTSPVPGVYCDDVDGGARLADSLLDLGHRLIAVALVPASYSLSQNIRGTSMIEQINRRGGRALAIDVESDRHIKNVIEQVLDDGQITALMCPTDAAMMEVLEELRTRGLRVPEDISVTGYDGIGFLASSYLGLTTFRQPVEEIGAVAVDLIIDAIEGNESLTGSHVAIRGSLLAGHTSGVPRATGDG